MTGTRNVDSFAFVHAVRAVVPSSTTPPYVSLKGYDHITFLVSYKNATTVTGSAITLSQATAVAGTSAKTLAFTTMFAAVNDAASVAVTQTAVSANTFTTDATNSQNGFYVIEVDASTLDLQNGFDCIALGTGNATAATIDAWYIMGGFPRFAGGYDSMMNPLVD
jgi:hypothetical protein